MGELADAIAQVQKYIRALNGIKAAPTNPTDAIGGDVFSICYPGTGRHEFGATGVRRGLHSLTIELHAIRKDLDVTIATLLPFGDSVPNLLMDKLLNDSKWNGTIDTFESISYAFVALGDYGGAPTSFWKFTVNGVKIQAALA